MMNALAPNEFSIRKAFISFIKKEAAMNAMAM
jgi:hypothetical protein